MPVFKVQFRRTVSRVVELEQATEVHIKAPTLAIAKDAMWRIDDELDGKEWEEVSGSRLASNDKIIVRAKPEWIDEVTGTSAKRGAISATELLGLVGEGSED